MRADATRDGATANSPAAANSAAAEQGISSARRSGADDSWWEIPVTRLFHFANPVLQREAVGKFRMRRVALWVIVFEAALALFVTWFYCRAVWWAVTIPDSRETIWWVLCFVALIVVMLVAPVMGAGVWSRERESGTFEPLMLSLLSSREMIWGKIAAPMLACFVFGLPLLPLLALCVRGVFHRSGMPGVSLTQAAATFAVIAATAWCYTAWGMLMSWRCKRTSGAVGATLATLLLFNIFVPFFLWEIGEMKFLNFNPVAALAAAVSPLEGMSPKGEIASALFAPALLFLAGCAILAVLHVAMKRRARESDRGFADKTAPARTGSNDAAG